MTTEIATAFAAYVLADPDHRRVPAEALLALPESRSFIVARLADTAPELAEQRAVLWQIAVFDAIGRLANDDDGWPRTAVEQFFEDLGVSIPGQAQLMLDLLEHGPLAASPSPDPLYRKAYALRRLGRFEEALRVADQCLRKIPPRQVQDRIRILQERDLILGEQAIEHQAAAARDAVRDQIQAAVATLEHRVAEQSAEIRRATTEGLFRIVEILGVFTAIIAVLGGTIASTAARGLAWWQRGILALVAGVVAIGFFLVLRLIVAPRQPEVKRGKDGGAGSTRP